MQAGRGQLQWQRWIWSWISAGINLVGAILPERRAGYGGRSLAQSSICLLFGHQKISHAIRFAIFIDLIGSVETMARERT